MRSKGMEVVEGELLDGEKMRIFYIKEKGEGKGKMLYRKMRTR